MPRPPTDEETTCPPVTRPMGLRLRNMGPTSEWRRVRHDDQEQLEGRIAVAPERWPGRRDWPLATFSAVLTALMACSSSASAPPAPPLSCQTLQFTDGVSQNCDCVTLQFNQEHLTPNDAVCSVASLGHGAVCHYWPDTPTDEASEVDPGCTCFAFDCDQDAAKTSVVCGYFRANDGRDPSVTVQPVPPSACTGQHYCFVPPTEFTANSLCECQDAPCAAGDEELSSCTDATAQAKLEVSVTFAGEIAVTDCRNSSSTL